jgi:hypothetical protein
VVATKRPRKRRKAIKIMDKMRKGRTYGEMKKEILLKERPVSENI